MQVTRSKIAFDKSKILIWQIPPIQKLLMIDVTPMEFNMKPESGTLSFSGSMWQGCKSSKIEKAKHENVGITIHLLDTSVSVYFEYIQYNLVSCDCSWDFLTERETQKVGCSESG